MAPAPEPESGVSHWVAWHAPYEDPASALSVRLNLVQACTAEALDERPPGPISVISLCAGQGRDVTDVLASHGRAGDVRALLVEQDRDLVAFARARAAAAGVGDRVEVVEGDASLTRHYAGAVPADLVLVCGVFGNISRDDIAGTIAALPSFCGPQASVIWTRHRRPPDLTPFIRAQFEAAGFRERSFHAPDGYVLTVGRHQLEEEEEEEEEEEDGSLGGSGGAPSPPGVLSGIPLVAKGVSGKTPSPAVAAFDPGLRLFEFTGDGGKPA